jgi:hypothetical protein
MMAGTATGGPLVAVGRVHGLGAALIAGTALLVAVAGVSIAIWQVSRVLIPPVTTTATLSSPVTRGLRTMIDAAPANFFDSAATGVDDLLRHRTIAVNIQIALLTETDRANVSCCAIICGAPEPTSTGRTPFVRWLLAMAHVWQIRAAFQKARRWCLLAVVLVTVGAVAFLTVTGHGQPR